MSATTLPGEAPIDAIARPGLPVPDGTARSPEDAVPSEAAAGRSGRSAKASKKQLRGSSLLLVGRFLSKGVNFAIQVMVVGHLSKSAYGAFTYALSYVELGESLATFGLDRSVTRFAPMYQERRDWGRFFGLLIMVLGIVLGLGVSLALLFRFFDRQLAGSFIDDPLALLLMGILVFMVPVQAFDTLMTGVFAVLASPKAIFFRKYVLAPALRLVVVLVLMLGGFGAPFLALGYLVAGIVGAAIYAVALYRLMREQRLFAHFDRHALVFPAREVFAFTLPLLSSDLVFVVTHWLDAFLLGYFWGTDGVASLRAVQPAAKLNLLVLASFGLLYTPAAARMFARGEQREVNQLYWSNATWTAVLTFPVFALTFALAGPLTLLLYGERYASSAVILALLSLGYYFSAALGQNGLTLKVFGLVRFVVIINLLSVVVNVAVNLMLIPRYGALGAAVGSCATMIVFNLLKQAGLRMGTGISLFDRRYVRVYGVIALGTAALLALQAVPQVPPVVDFAFAVVVALAVVGLNRRILDVATTFPELLRVPGAPRFFGVPAPVKTKKDKDLDG
jgi:O-antigen/teichoic acid export membrane protein